MKAVSLLLYLGLIGGSAQSSVSSINLDSDGIADTWDMLRFGDLTTAGTQPVTDFEHDDNLSGAWTDCGLGTFLPNSGTHTDPSSTLPDSPARFIRAVAVRPLRP